MGKPALGLLLIYLTIATGLLLHALYGIWAAVPPPATSMAFQPPDFVAQPAPADGRPRILQLDPETVMNGAVRPTVRIFGHNFRPESQVLLDGVMRPAAFVDEHQLVLSLAGSDLATPGTIAVNVITATQRSDATTLVIEPAEARRGTWHFLGWEFHVSSELRLLLIVFVAGAFGACIMALQSLADYRGSKDLDANWTIFYWVRPPIGGGVALVFYFVVRGGFLAGTSIDVGASTPFGIAALAMLVGMFSDNAVLKLNEVFTTFFRTDDTRSGKLGGPVIDAKAVPVASIGQAYNHTLTATGGKPPYKWSVSPALPPGLTLNATTGGISGTPAGPASTTKLKVTVTDAISASAAFDCVLDVR
jgi:hypothetical protein